MPTVYKKTLKYTLTNTHALLVNVFTYMRAEQVQVHNKYYEDSGIWQIKVELGGLKFNEGRGRKPGCVIW